MNQALPSLHGGSLKITRTVPLSNCILGIVLIVCELSGFVYCTLYIEQTNTAYDTYTGQVLYSAIQCVYIHIYLKYVHVLFQIEHFLIVKRKQPKSLRILSKEIRELKTLMKNEFC